MVAGLVLLVLVTVTHEFGHAVGNWLTGSRVRGALAADPAVVAPLKDTYSSTVGKFGERDHRPDYHLWRPDWRYHIIANSRTAILHTLCKIHDASGAAALAVDPGAIAFAIDDPDRGKPGRGRSASSAPA